MTDPNALTAARLKATRERLGLSQRELAAALREHGADIENSATISRYENWETYRRQPAVDYVRALAQVAGTTTDYLVGLVDSPEPYAATEDRRRLQLIREVLG